jgi:hypothetical protein
VARPNPKARVRVLVDGDLVVCGSTQILEYLEDRTPSRRSTRPTSGGARSRRLEAFADEIPLPPRWELIDAGSYPGEGSANAARLADAGTRLAALCAAPIRGSRGRFRSDRASSVHRPRGAAWRRRRWREQQPLARGDAASGSSAETPTSPNGQRRNHVRAGGNGTSVEKGLAVTRGRDEASLRITYTF